jgi:hypothetical protein
MVVVTTAKTMPMEWKSSLWFFGTVCFPPYRVGSVSAVPVAKCLPQLLMVLESILCSWAILQPQPRTLLSITSTVTSLCETTKRPASTCFLALALPWRRRNGQLPRVFYVPYLLTSFASLEEHHEIMKTTTQQVENCSQNNLSPSL